MLETTGNSVRRHRRPTAVLAACLGFIAILAFIPGSAGAADIGALQSKVASAKAEAGGLASQLQQEQARLFHAQVQAAAAAARERQLSTLLAAGERRAAILRGQVAAARRKLQIEKRRLARARAALAARLVGIYEDGTPDAASIILSSGGFDDLTTRASYLRLIENSDSSLAKRVRQVRNQVAAQLAIVAELKARVDAYNVRLTNARNQIGAVRAQAESEAAGLASAKAAQEATLSSLRGSISSWTSQIQQAQQVSAAAAQQEVGRWLGGPFSVPSYIVSCESGGNYGALNPSSGAGGAYQILPSTWAMYGGNGSPQNGSKQQQDQIAAQIWADSGASAWVCGH